MGYFHDCWDWTDDTLLHPTTKHLIELCGTGGSVWVLVPGGAMPMSARDLAIMDRTGGLVPDTVESLAHELGVLHGFSDTEALSVLEHHPGVPQPRPLILAALRTHAAEVLAAAADRKRRTAAGVECQVAA